MAETPPPAVRKLMSMGFTVWCQWRFKPSTTPRATVVARKDDGTKVQTWGESMEYALRDLATRAEGLEYDRARDGGHRGG